MTGPSGSNKTGVRDLFLLIEGGAPGHVVGFFTSHSEALAWHAESKGTFKRYVIRFSAELLP